MIIHTFTDSSSRGFGAWTDNDYLFGFWDKKEYKKFYCPHVVASPGFDYISQAHINIMELWPVVASLHKWGE